MYRTRTTLRRLVVIGGASVALLAGAACGDDESTGSDTPTTAAASAPTTQPATTAPVTSAPATTEAHAGHDADTSTTAAPTTAPATTAAPSTTAAPVVAEPGALEVTTQEYGFVGLPTTMRAGTYTMTVTNAGAEAHEVVIFRPTTGKTLEELEALGPQGAIQHMELAAFVAPAGPGAVSAPTEFTLTPGEWTAVCFIPAPDGEPHFHHGMTQTIEVVA